MKESTREEPKIVAAAERQMRAWDLAQQIADRMIRVDQEHLRGKRIGPYISISREAGAGGEELAQLLGHELGWEVLDKELVDKVAEHFRLSRPMLDLVDETKSTWVQDVLGPWVDPKLISHERYVVDLGRVIVSAARQGRAIFVGRGAHFILPPDAGLSVRLIASEKFRVERMAMILDSTPEQARRYVTDVDHDRREFVKRFFHRDVNDPHLYDLVINVERLGLPAAADVIVEACRQRGYVQAS